MPTGYTAEIGEGMCFKDFVLRCARAMGALITLRDEPLNAPIPDALGSSDYHEKKLAEAKAEYERLKALTTSQADDEARHQYESDMSAYRKRMTSNAELVKKYEMMLAEVRAWTPPTSDHQGLKTFMIEQLTESIKFDCNTSYDKEPEMVDGMTWLRGKLEKAVRDIGYHTKEGLMEEERNRSRNLWLKQLRDSLNCPQPTIQDQTNESA